MNEDVREGRRGFKLRGWHVIVGILAVLVSLFILLRVFSHSALERKIAELRAKGYPTSFEELEKYNQLPDGVPNAADLYVKAFNAFREPTENERKLFPYLDWRRHDDPLTPETLAAMEEYLSRNVKTLELLHQAGQVESCRYAYLRDSSFGYQNPNLRAIKDCTVLLNLHALSQLEKGQVSDALHSILDSLRLGESLLRDPFLISYLSQLAVNGATVGTIAQILDRQSFSEQQMADLQERLHGIQNGLRLDRAYIGERCLWLDEPFLQQSFGRGFFAFHWSGMMNLNSMQSLEFYDQIADVETLSPDKRKEEYRRIEKEIEKLPRQYMMTRILFPTVEQPGLINLRIKAQIDSGRAALGVERFRLEEGRLPGSLEELVPKFIESVPIDPFDGKPLRYKRLVKGYTIY